MKIIIIGGGFAGINAARALKRSPVEITLIDRTNHHVFQPLLYQVATAALSVDNIASPIREVLSRQKNVEVLMGEVEKIDAPNKQIIVKGGDTYDYDFLIVATGAKQSYFGKDEWEEYAPGLKTIADGVHIREKILLAFEQAERSSDLKLSDWYLNFVIIGGGPTGVEMAGSIAEFAHRTLVNNFRRIKPENANIYLIEGAEQLLPSYPSDLAHRAQRDLENLKVDILLNKRVTKVTEQGVYLGDEFLPAATVIWTAGNEASPLLKTLNVPLDRQGRVIVDKYLTIPGYDNIFVVGDAACFYDKEGQALPGIAPVAIQQGRYVANYIKRVLNKQDKKPFSYFDKGMMATIGRGKAVATFRNLKLTGFTAWLLWCFIHIFYLISFPNRVIVMFQWIFLYFMGRRHSRVITGGIDEAQNDPLKNKNEEK